MGTEPGVRISFIEERAMNVQELMLRAGRSYFIVVRCSQRRF